MRYRELTVFQKKILLSFQYKKYISVTWTIPLPPPPPMFFQQEKNFFFKYNIYASAFGIYKQKHSSSAYLVDYLLTKARRSSYRTGGLWELPWPLHL